MSDRDADITPQLVSGKTDRLIASRQPPRNFPLAFCLGILFSSIAGLAATHWGDRWLAQTQPSPLGLQFITTDNHGKTSDRGKNYVLLFHPQAQRLDFKTYVAVAHDIDDPTAGGGFQKKYVPKRFHEIFQDKNARLRGKKPIAAINGDSIDITNKPQGLNVSRGIEYSGISNNQRSSFAISGGEAKSRVATIQIGKRTPDALNFNAVGGNGRFYKNGQFRDICEDLGDFACKQETNRSIAAITSQGYVIFLVNNSERGQELYPDQFDDVLERIASDYKLGTVQEGMLFDGGLSTAFYFNDRIYTENSNPIGSAFLIYAID
jgi:hypothetical protein